MIASRRRLCLAFALTLPAVTHTAMADCSRADIDYYLGRGFTPTQVTNLCSGVSEPSSGTPTPASPDSSTPSASAPAAKSEALNLPSGISIEDWFKIKNAIDADEVTATDSELSYRRNRCEEFGEPDAAGFKSKACVTVNTTLSRSGLTVLKAEAGIPILKPREFLVTSDKIERKALDPERIKGNRIRTKYLESFVSSPTSLDIPLRGNFKPSEMAEIFNKLAK